MIDYKKKYNKYKFKYLNAKKLIYGGFWRGGGSELFEQNVDENKSTIEISLRYKDDDEISISVDPSSNVHTEIKTHLKILENQHMSINLGINEIGENETFNQAGIQEGAKISAKISTSLSQKTIDLFNELVYNTNTIITGRNATLPGPIESDPEPRTYFYDNDDLTEREIEKELTLMINTMTNEQLLLFEKYSLEKKTKPTLVFNQINLNKFHKRIDFILTQVRIAKLERNIQLNKEDLFDLKVFEHASQYDVKKKLMSNLEGITHDDLLLLEQYVIEQYIQAQNEENEKKKKLIERINSISEVLKNIADSNRWELLGY